MIWMTTLIRNKLYWIILYPLQVQLYNRLKLKMINKMSDHVAHPQLIRFIQRLIVMLKISSIIWLHNDETAPIADSLIATANTTHSYALNIDRTHSVLDRLTGLPIGPDYVCIYLVDDGSFVRIEKLSETLILAFKERLCRHVIIELESFEMNMTSSYWFVPQLFAVCIAVSLSANRSDVSDVKINHLVVSNSNHQQPTQNATQFFDEPSLLLRMMRRESSVLPTLEIEVKSTLMPHDCMIAVNTATSGDRRLIGRDVALYKLIAERIGAKIMLRYDTYYNEVLARATFLKEFHANFSESLWLNALMVKHISR